MSINYLAPENITTIPGAASTATSIALQVASLLYGAVAVFPMMGRRRRHAHDPAQARTYAHDDNSLVRDMVFKVVDDLDDPACLPLALCHASSIPQNQLTKDHKAIISLLSPLQGTPFSWPDVNKPSAKYQYASFVGKWAGLTGELDQCRRVFPTCIISGEDVIKSVNNWKFPCSVEGSKNKIES